MDYIICTSNRTEATSTLANMNYELVTIEQILTSPGKDLIINPDTQKTFIGKSSGANDYSLDVAGNAQDDPLIDKCICVSRSIPNESDQQIGMRINNTNPSSRYFELFDEVNNSSIMKYYLNGTNIKDTEYPDDLKCKTLTTTGLVGFVSTDIVVTDLLEPKTAGGLINVNNGMSIQKSTETVASPPNNFTVATFAGLLNFGLRNIPANTLLAFTISNSNVSASSVCLTQIVSSSSSASSLVVTMGPSAPGILAGFVTNTSNINFANTFGIHY